MSIPLQKKMRKVRKFFLWLDPVSELAKFNVGKKTALRVNLGAGSKIISILERHHAVVVP